ncbi:NADH-quinone oxidoreductase subunit NuoB [Myxococcota bacterium]|nr:NADH-quinone oxidoreductase subunit NuoB [Myxococcota bacterium]MBU1431163.1 NADH-quinone oxidoreductase subunit NuoB [Myxococcota bacterium]MBU1896650.1 NADH-quinone oxidoreductase subunit NuoB [Myxococcota bacterium]
MRDELPVLHGVPPIPEGSQPHARCQDECFLGEKPEPLKYREAIQRIKNWFRANSLHVLAYGTGCGSIELRPLGTARFDMERFGISTRPTPRHANVLIISGYLSIKTLKRVIRSYEQMPSPKWVVGLGSCTINGGMYWDSYATMKQLDLYLPVDMYISGCMPRPEALIEGFAALMDKIKKGEANGYLDYLERLDWYRENQKKIIHDWDLPDYSW